MADERERVFSKQFLPGEDDPRWQQWQKKRLFVRMMPLKGPVTIITVDAPTKLPPEWEGWLAVDMAGHPYPLHRDVQAVAYEPVQPAGTDERERQIRERLEHWRLKHWHCQVCGWWGPQCCTCPNCGSDTGKPLVSDAENLAYLLDALAAAREENGRLREAAERLDRFWRSLNPLEAIWPPELVKAMAGIQVALAREDGGGVPE